MANRLLLAFYYWAALSLRLELCRGLPSMVRARLRGKWRRHQSRLRLLRAVHGDGDVGPVPGCTETMEHGDGQGRSDGVEGLVGRDWARDEERRSGPDAVSWCGGSVSHDVVCPYRPGQNRGAALRSGRAAYGPACSGGLAIGIARRQPLPPLPSMCTAASIRSCFSSSVRTVRPNAWPLGILSELIELRHCHLP